MRQGSRFNIEDVVSHLPGRDASLRWMKTSHGAPLKASANRSGQDLAIAITQRQWTASGDLTIRPLLSTSEDLGMKAVLLAANCAGTGPPSITWLYALYEN